MSKKIECWMTSLSRPNLKNGFNETHYANFLKYGFVLMWTLTIANRCCRWAPTAKLCTIEELPLFDPCARNPLYRHRSCTTNKAKPLMSFLPALPILSPRWKSLTYTSPITCYFSFTKMNKFTLYCWKKDLSCMSKYSNKEAILNVKSK